MPETGAVFFYGVWINRPSIIICSSAHKALQDPLLALALISLRQENGTLRIDSHHRATIKSLPVELLQLVRRQLIAIEEQAAIETVTADVRCSACKLWLGILDDTLSEDSMDDCILYNQREGRAEEIWTLHSKKFELPKCERCVSHVGNAWSERHWEQFVDDEVSAINERPAAGQSDSSFTDLEPCRIIRPLFAHARSILKRHALRYRPSDVCASLTASHSPQLVVHTLPSR